MSDFDTAKKKGDIGEDIVQQYLEDKGYIVYKIATKKDEPHRFDFFVDHLEKECFLLDVKTKARLNNWARQGIDTKHYIKYREFAEQRNMPFFIFFVDDKNGDVHCANILKIEDAMYIKKGTVITWPLEQMTHLFTLDQEQIDQLSQYDQRNHPFNPTLL